MQVHIRSHTYKNIIKYYKIIWTRVWYACRLPVGLPTETCILYMLMHIFHACLNMCHVYVYICLSLSWPFSLCCIISLYLFLHTLSLSLLSLSFFLSASSLFCFHVGSFIKHSKAIRMRIRMMPCGWEKKHHIIWLQYVKGWMDGWMGAKNEAGKYK